MKTSAAVELPAYITIGKDVCADLQAAEQQEWLVTNGIGGFACGTLAGTLTRRYHGLLVAALEPPRKRTLLVAKIDEIAHIGANAFVLGTNRWASGAIDPSGYREMESFRLEGAVPVWTYASGGARIEKRVWMQHGANTTFVSYSLLESALPVIFELKVLVNYRDFNSLTHAQNWRMGLEQVAHGIKVIPYESATPFYLLSAEAAAEPACADGAGAGSLWYRDFELSEEKSRGFDDREDHLHAATFRGTVNPGGSISLVFTIDSSVRLDAAQSRDSNRDREAKIIATGRAALAPSAASVSALLDQLILAADSFVVAGDRRSGTQHGYGIIAGYPWFGVWGRDALISLAGLLLVTGRTEAAREVLERFARAIDHGMLPNFFPESGAAPEFNSVDAPLWFVEAVREYVARTGDLDFAREMIFSIGEIISAYMQGTRFGIHVDTSDALLFAGESGTNLTWMDARVNGVPVTPRVGKPVEVNALWLNAVTTFADLAEGVGRPVPGFRRLAERIRAGFVKFWNSAANCCFDVIDGPAGDDTSLRPNQILAVSLRASALSAAQQRAVVDVCARELLTPVGLRSLGPNEPGYRGHYQGSQAERDAAYHQGTAWMWLLGAFVQAHYRVYKDRAVAEQYLQSAAAQLTTGALGSLSEIYDGDAPFTPRGCFAQAWSVAELLRGWDAISSRQDRA